MPGRVEDKVVLITGAARGQGRSHARRLASEGADIVAIDYCTNIDTVTYSMSTEEDLDETANLVTSHGRRVMTIQADVRDYAAMQDAVERALAVFGRLDVVIPNAAVSADGAVQTMQAWADVNSINLVGVLNTLNATLPRLTEGASIIVIGSLAALLDRGVGAAIGAAAYSVSKRSLIGIVKQLASTLAPLNIRANGIHPTNTNTPMLQHEDMYRLFRPDLPSPTREDAIPAFSTLQTMPTPWVEPEDVSEAVLFLASDESRWITGQFIGVDAGAMLKI